MKINKKIKNTMYQFWRLLNNYKVTYKMVLNNHKMRLSIK